MRSAIGNLKLALAYTLLAMGTLQTLVPEGGASPVWPPSGLALGALLIGGAHYWPGIVLGQLLGNGLVTGHWLMALGFGLGNAAAGLAGYHLFLRLKGKGAITFETPSDFVVLIAAGVVAAAAS